MIRIKLSLWKTWYRSADLHNLYHTLLPPVSTIDSKNDVITIDETLIKGEAFRQQFADWVRNNPSKILGPAEAPAPVSTSVELDDDLARLQRAQRVQREQEAAREKMIEDAANARLKQWIEAGLLDVTHNHNLMVNHIERNRMQYTAANLDIIVNHLKDQLHWAIWSKHAPQNQVQVEPPQPEEVLGRVKATGEKQLPLNSTEADLRKASTAQVQDWLERKREATGQKYVRSKHSHGTTFVEPTMN